MNKQQKRLYNGRLNQELAASSRRDTLRLLAHLLRPTPGFANWRQFLLQSGSTVAKELYRQHLLDLRDARQTYDYALGLHLPLYPSARSAA